MKNAETNDKKLDEFLTACVVKQVKAQGFVPLEVTGVDVGKIELDMKNGTYGELPFVSLFCKSRTSDNERVEKTTWHTVTLWNKLAEIVEQYTGKGSSIYIEGRLETDKWQDQNGQNRYTTKIIAESVQLLDKRPR